MSTLRVNNVTDIGLDAVVTNGVVVKGALPSGTILQVVSTTKTDTFSTTTTGYVDVTGLSVSITPSSSTSKVLLFATVNWGLNNTSDSHGLIKITGGNTASYVGDTAGSRTRAATGGRWSTAFSTLTGGWTMESSMNYLDSPATTSAVTYQVQISRASGTVYVNRSHDDNDASHFGRFASSITAMEVAA